MEPSKVTIFTPSEEIIFEKTLQDGRVVTVHPAYENAKVFRVKCGDKFTRDSYQKLAGVRGGGFCLPFGKDAAFAMSPEEIDQFNQQWQSYLDRLDAQHLAQSAARRAALDQVHPRLNWAIDTYGTYEEAQRQEDTFAADLLLQFESGTIGLPLNDSEGD
jgi:hypothetical protein